MDVEGNTRMTPQEISDYKQKWMSSEINNPVELHSDLESNGIQWCRKNLEPQQWKLVRWSKVYSHTFFFEKNKFAQDFASKFDGYVVKLFDNENQDLY
jgi:5-bromo-4-chloroindolyl phosphate hydrolysis protein